MVGFVPPPIPGGDAVVARKDYQVAIEPIEPDLDAHRACLVEIYGSRPARRIDLVDEAYEIGRIDSNAIVIDSPSVSRVHARLSHSRFGLVIADLDSTNGTFVNDARVRECPLRRGDHIKIGTTIFKVLGGPDVDESYAAERSRIAVTDGLTQAMNRACFVETIEQRRLSARVSSRVLALLLVEVPDFASVCERHQVVVGERVVSLLAGLLRQRVRSEDALARVGRACFAMLLDHTDLEATRALGRKISRHVQLSTFRCNDSVVPVQVRTRAVELLPNPEPPAVRVVEQALLELRRSPDPAGE